MPKKDNKENKEKRKAKRQRIDDTASSSPSAHDDSFVSEQEHRLKTMPIDAPVLSICLPQPPSKTATDSTTAPPAFHITSNDLLSQMIYPISKATFLQHAFRKKALHITSTNRDTATTTTKVTKTARTSTNGSGGGGGAGKSNTGSNKSSSVSSSRIQSIVDQLHQLDPEYLFTETSSDNVFVWLHKQGKDVGNHKDDNNDKNKNDTDCSQIHSMECSDAHQAVLLHTLGGHATYCRAPPMVEQPMVANLLQGTGYGCGQYDPSGDSSISLGRGEVEIFIGAKTTNTKKQTTATTTTQWHYDFQENFTIQLSGIKRWKLQQGTVRYPSRACTPHYASPETVESQLKAIPSTKFQFGYPRSATASGVNHNHDNNHHSYNATGHVQEVTLYPGDVLYFPAGMWHQVTTIESGVSINTSLMATNYATLTCQALQHYLLFMNHPNHDNNDDDNRDNNINVVTGVDNLWRETVSNNDGNDVLHKLQHLLNTLPQIIQTFTQTYGAAAILPPILRHPPSFQQIKDDDDQWHEHNDDDDNEEEKDDEESMEQDHDDNNNSNDDSSDENNDDDDDDDVDPVLGTSSIINVATFQPPSGWTPFQTLPSPAMTESYCSQGGHDYEKNGTKLEYQLVMNPLAWVRPVKDITRFYANANATISKHDDDDKNDSLFIININFGGNEMQESAVRIIVRDEEDHPTMIHYNHHHRQQRHVPERRPRKFTNDDADVDTHHSIPLSCREECYLYHGLYCWALLPNKNQKRF